MVLYNEHNPDEDAIGSITTADLRTRPDALIVVGTTLKVPGVKRIVKEMCGVVRGRRDGATIWINKNPPPPGPGIEWDLIVSGPCDRVAELAKMPRWNDNPLGEAVSKEDGERICQQNGSKLHNNNEVVINTPLKLKTFERVQGQMTPIASPPWSPITPEKKPDELLPAINLLMPLKLPNPPAQIKKTGMSKPVKTTKPKATAPKRTASKKKNAADGNAKISAAFRLSKAAAKAPTAKAKEPAFPGLSSFYTRPPVKVVHPTVEEPQPMQPVSPGAARNNSSPPYKAPPAKSEKGAQPAEVPVESIANQLSEGPRTPVRHQTPEERKEILVPSVSSPGIRSILNGYEGS
jgi:NAD-dependent histone deacetylase SIR2